MSSVTVDIRGIGDFQKRLAALRAEVPKAAQQALREEAELVMTAAKQEIDQQGKTNLGTLKSSGLVVSNPAAVEVTLGFGGASAPYALFVHEGTRPHFPPVSALVPWVKRKLRLPEKDAKSVAFLVARKISRVGTAPSKFLERPFLAATRGLSERVNRRMSQLILRTLGKS